MCRYLLSRCWVTGGRVLGLKVSGVALRVLGVS